MPSEPPDHRRAPPRHRVLPNYRDLAYYERGASATEKPLVEKGLLTMVEIDGRFTEIHRRREGA